jgi:hypothetical protein
MQVTGNSIKVNMQKLELFDETFDPFRTESYELSIQVSLNGFSFCINDTSRNCFIALVCIPTEQIVVEPDDWDKNIQQLFNKIEWLKRPFRKVFFTFESHSFAIVPSQYFDKQNPKQILSISHPISEDDEVWSNTIQNDYTTIFNIPSSLISSWIKVHNNSKILGFCDPVLFYHLNSSNFSKDTLITISFSKDFAIVSLSQKGNLLHLGSISNHTNEDIIYHLVNICMQVKVNPNDVEVRFYGIFEQKENLNILTNRFFKSSIEINSFGHLHFSYLLEKHKFEFLNLFNQSLCE